MLKSRLLEYMVKTLIPSLTTVWNFNLAKVKMLIETHFIWKPKRYALQNLASVKTVKSFPTHP